MEIESKIMDNEKERRSNLAELFLRIVFGSFSGLKRKEESLRSQLQECTDFFSIIVSLNLFVLR